MAKYQVYNDAAHGWVKVPVKRLIELGIEQEITKWSYLSKDGRYAFLEEDQDATTFVDAAIAQGETPTFRDNYSYKSSKIRNYPNYQPEWVTQNREALLVR